MSRRIVVVAFVAVVLCLGGVVVYHLPPVYERMGWRIEALRADVKYALNPPEQIVFVPQKQSTAGLPTATRTPQPTMTLPPTPTGPTSTPSPTLTHTPTLTPLPQTKRLDGFTHEFQMWNNCGPANLSMALSYWGWNGNQRDTAEFLKPNQRDKNVMPYEMADFVEEQTELSAIVRVGGNIELLKKLVVAGFPVIVEKGFEGPGFEGWMGHYEVVNGYDDGRQEFYAQDSYKGADFPVSYEQFSNQWRAFNYTFIVIYPPHQEDEVMEILGRYSREEFADSEAEKIAGEEAETLSGRDQYFAMYNLGTNYVNLRDYAAAARAFDEAFAAYQLIPEEVRPWRMLWYQTGPYFAYYYTGRYEDVVNLATTTLDAMSEPILEESFYWRARARLAIGDREGAIEDLLESLEHHPEFAPSLLELRKLGVDPEI